MFNKIVSLGIYEFKIFKNQKFQKQPPLIRFQNIRHPSIYIDIEKMILFVKHALILFIGFLSYTTCKLDGSIEFSHVLILKQRCFFVFFFFG